MKIDEKTADNRLSVLLAAALSGCSLETLDQLTDDAINAIGTTVSDAMEDVDVREILSGVGDKVSEIMDGLPDTTSSLREAVSQSSTDSSTDVTEGESYLSREDVTAYLHAMGTAAQLPDGIRSGGPRVGWVGRPLGHPGRGCDRRRQLR